MGKTIKQLSLCFSVSRNTFLYKSFIIHFYISNNRLQYYIKGCSNKKSLLFLNNQITYMKLSQLSILFILLFIHSFVQANPLKVGSWMGNLNLQNTHELIFNLKLIPIKK